MDIITPRHLRRNMIIVQVQALVPLEQFSKVRKLRPQAMAS